MTYRVEYSKTAEKSLRKLDKPIAKNILNWIENHLIGTENPRQFGKGLVGNLGGKWRYRVGDYRIIADIQDDCVLILIVQIEHRSKVYM